MKDLFCKGCDEFVMEMSEEDAEFISALCSNCWEI
jgi:hypothetical protein